MKSSVKVNYIYNLINTISGLLFPLITFPYVSRVIMAEGVGLVSFYNTLIGYVVLLTNLGIPTYGIKEIASVRDNIYELNKTSREILLLNLFTNSIGYIAIFLLSLSVSRIQEELPLFFLLSSSIFLTTIGCPWFFSGIEDFKYVTIRGLIVRTICTVLLFFFVKTKDDLLYYGLYTILAQVGNYIVNYIRFRGYQKKCHVPFRDLHPFRHFRPALNIFVFNLITSIYLKLDIAMIGFMKEPVNVGFYTASSNLAHMFLSLITSLGQATTPRLTNLIANKDDDAFQKLAQKSYRFILCAGFPITLGIIITAPILIHIFSGPTFEPAINTLRILSFVIIAIGISNLLGLQILYPLGKVKIINISVAIGALVNFIANLIFIPRFAQDGAAFATILAEFSVTFSQIAIAYKFIPFKLLDRQLVVYLLSSLIMSISCLGLMALEIPEYYKIFIVPLAGIIVYGSILLLAKDPIVNEIVSIIKKKI